MAVVLGYANLDQYRPAKAQAADLAVLRALAVVVGVVEWSRLSKQRIWSSLPVLSAESMRSAWHNRGHKIRARRFRAVRVQPPGLPAFWFVVVHMPPKRMWGPLYVAYAFRLRKFLRSLPGEKVVFGDWNKRIEGDPARLRRTFKGRWHGSRIDGCWVSPGLVRYVAGYREQRQPERKDNHPFCFLTLDEGVSPMSYKFEKRSSPNHSTRQHYGYPSKPTGITIHHWGNPGQTHDGVVKYLCREGGNTSAHEVISAGRVTQLVEHDRAAWHAGSTRGNGSTIGLECRPEMSAADWATLVERCADIEEIHGSMRYYRHSDWKATACPGKYGPRLGELIEAVNAEHARRAVAKKPLPETGLSRRRADLAAWRKRLGSKRPRVRAAIDAFLKGTPKR